MAVEKKEIVAQKEKLSYYKALNDIGNQIHSAQNINEILINLEDQILSLFDADRITIYVVDGIKKEIYSRFKAGPMGEIRVPINNNSIAGYTANNAQPSNIVNAYDKHELSMINKDLSFDKSWDEKSKYVTKQVLTVPIFFKKYVIGVLQLVNKKGGDRFTMEDQNSATEMAKVLGIAFFNDLKVKKVEVGKSIGEFFNCEYVPYDSSYPIPGELLSKLKHSYLKNNLWVPLRKDEGKE